MPYFLIFIFLTLAFWVGNAAIALFLGVSMTFLVNLSEDFFTKRIGTKLLQAGIVFLGASISIPEVVEISGNYLPWVSFFVITTFVISLGIGRMLKTADKQSYLLAAGTSICGGTAMTVVAPIVKAKPEQLLSSIAIIFILNALAIIFFPLAGTWMGLSQEQFGIWAALAIHDTSSVVGAASIFGDKALEVAIVLKLGRTLWIIPLVLFSAWYFREKRSGTGLPIFVVFFIFAVILNSLLSPSEQINIYLKQVNKVFLLSGLFCIGTQINQSALQRISIKPLILAILVWSMVIIASLWII